MHREMDHIHNDTSGRPEGRGVTALFWPTENAGVDLGEALRKTRSMWGDLLSIDVRNIDREMKRLDQMLECRWGLVHYTVVSMLMKRNWKWWGSSVLGGKVLKIDLSAESVPVMGFAGLFNIVHRYGLVSSWHGDWMSDEDALARCDDLLRGEWQCDTEWYAIDSEGQIALFFCDGAVPRAITTSMARIELLDEYFESAPVVCGAKYTPHCIALNKTRLFIRDPDPIMTPSERGVYTYHPAYTKSGLRDRTKSAVFFYKYYLRGKPKGSVWSKIKEAWRADWSFPPKVFKKTCIPLKPINYADLPNEIAEAVSVYRFDGRFAKMDTIETEKMW